MSGAPVFTTLCCVVGWLVGGTHAAGIAVCGFSKLGPTMQPANATPISDRAPHLLDIFILPVPILGSDYLPDSALVIRIATPRSDRAATPSTLDKIQRQPPPSPPRRRRSRSPGSTFR